MEQKNRGMSNIQRRSNYLEIGHSSVPLLNIFFPAAIGLSVGHNCFVGTFKTINYDTDSSLSAGAGKRSSSNP